MLLHYLVKCQVIENEMTFVTTQETDKENEFIVSVIV